MYKNFRPRVRSKNTSCEQLRAKNNGLGLFPARSIVRLGSTTKTSSVFINSFGRHRIIEINTVEAIENSRSKLLMKKCFYENKVKQSLWWESDQALAHDENPIPFPILAKRIYGFKGHGMIKIDSPEELNDFLKKTSQTALNGYYFEQFHNYAREYRLHVTKHGCFMSWRKLRRSDSEERWFFNSSNCNWVGEKHELFDKPSNWNIVEEHCVRALNSTGLDIGACDVRIQSSKKEDPDFIVVEINSAPALGDNGLLAYKEIISNLIKEKISNANT